MEIVQPSHEILSEIDKMSIYKAIELAGRTAYKSEDKITEKSSILFITNLITRGHESVLEHVNISVRFICDRGVTHEIVRHRLVSYTQESTRYCDYARKGMTVIRPPFWAAENHLYECWGTAMKSAERAYNYLMDNGATPQEARSVLPNSLKTEIVCTANIREWRHILTLRCSKAAHPQMRQLMIPLLKELKDKLPILFGSIPEE